MKYISTINIVDRKNSISLDVREKTAGHSKKAVHTMPIISINRGIMYDARSVPPMSSPW